MNFEPIEKSDIDFLLSANAFFKDGWTESMLVSAFNAGNFYGYIASVNGEKAGFITFTVAVDTADIGDIFVFEKFRRQGIARALLTLSAEKLKTLGVSKIFLEVRANNSAAISLYLSQGFKEYLTRKKYYADGEDALCMSKEI